MANAPNIRDIPFKLQELSEKQEYHFKKLFQENDHHYTNISSILNRLDVLEGQTNFTQSDNLSKPTPNTTCNEEYQECPDQELEEQITALKLEIAGLKYRVDNPGCALSPHSFIQQARKTHPDGSPVSEPVEQLTRELEATKQELKCLQQSIASTENTEEYSIMKERMIALEAENRMLNYRLDNPEYLLSSHAIHNRIVTDESHGLEGNYSDVQNPYPHLRAQIEEMSRDNSAKGRKIKELEQELLKRGDNVQGRNSGIQASLQSQEEDNARNEEMLSLRQENKTLQEELEQLRSPNIDSLTKGERELLQSVLKEKSVLSSKLRTNETQIAELQQALDVSQRRCTGLEGELHNLMQQRDQLYTQYSQQQNSLNMNNQAIDKALQDRDKLISDLQQENREKQDAIASHQATLTVLQGDLVESESKLGGHNSEVSKLKGMLREKDKEISELHFQLEKDKNIRNPHHSLPGYPAASFAGSAGHPGAGAYNTPRGTYN